MDKMTAGITRRGESYLGREWNIMGQIYVPMQLSEDSFAWHATFPAGTFVPPHIHPTQDEFLYIQEGRFDFLLEGKEEYATPGDLVRLPKGIPHGIFNNSGETAKCLFWVAPTRKLADLFQAIHDLPEQTPETVVPLSAQHEVEFLPPPGS